MFSENFIKLDKKCMITQRISYENYKWAPFRFFNQSNFSVLIHESNCYDPRCFKIVNLQIVAVISNVATAAGLKVAREAGVKNVRHVPHTKDRVTGDLKMHQASSTKF